MKVLWDLAEQVADERKLICKWLMLMQIMPHMEPADYATLIEKGEHHKPSAETVEKYRKKDK